MYLKISVAKQFSNFCDRVLATSGGLESWSTLAVKMLITTVVSGTALHLYVGFTQGMSSY